MGLNSVASLRHLPRALTGESGDFGRAVSGTASGFFTAVDLAWGFPLSFSSEATEGASGKTLEFKQNAEKYLQHGVPLIGLVSFGYLF